MKILACLAFALVLSSTSAHAQTSPRPRVYVDSTGVIRWTDTKAEVALFGANYTLPSSSDYRAAGYLGLDRKKLVDEDMAQFARMGWGGLRLSFWGDWENADSLGNLIANEHLDLLDYVIAKARERGIWMLLSPITTYESTWPDAEGDTTPKGFSRFYKKSELGTNPRAIAAQANYLRQLLHHVNPYTHVALEDEPSILFIEMINEPIHHSADVPGSVAYIDSLVAAVRSTRSKAITFHNVSQDFAIAESIRRSTVQGVTFGWYPTGLNSGHELRGSFLRSVDDYPPMRDPLLARLPRIVYEFDSPDLRTGYMYPAMARSFRAVGAQFAAMFSYDMLGTASRNLGWQTHYLNLVYTPRKAISAVIAAEVMRRLPRNAKVGAYPADTIFGDFRVSDAGNSSVLAASDAYMNAGATTVRAPHPGQLTRVYGYQSSPVVRYDGEGTYFLDRIRPGVWRLEVYPDAVPVRDPFERPSPDKIVTRAVWQSHEMRLALPDLGAKFTVERVAPASHAGTYTAGGRLSVMPGVYILYQGSRVADDALPATLGALGMREFHAPPTDPATLTLFRAGDDAGPAGRLAFSRIGDGYREGIYRVVNFPDGESALQISLPTVEGKSPPEYRASLYVGDRIASGVSSVGEARVLRVRLRGLGGADTLHLTLVERDGASWGADVPADSTWRERTIPLVSLRPVRGANLPEGFPGEWNYWIEPPADRGGAGDRIRLAEVERLQLSLRPSSGGPPRVEVEWVRLGGE